MSDNYDRIYHHCYFTNMRLGREGGGRAYKAMVSNLRR